MFAVLALSIAGGIYLFPKGGSLLGAALFLLLRLSLWSIPGDHRAGIYLVRKQQFEDAIPHFLRSFEFFQRRLWLDKYRAILMLSTTAISYREMALVNAAFCYSQIGDGENARKYYEQCLGLFPDSVLALSALRMMQAAVSVHQDTYDNESDRTKP
ncbi:MAG: hypothetical protein KDA90_22865 [Planctomycetaceae bacterium]|nr:hypothetical protein [Planctomycetaceae bacterium]